MSIYKTYILLTSDFVFARGIELEIKNRIKDARIVSGLRENGTKLIDLLKKDDAFPKQVLVICDLDTISTKSIKELAVLGIGLITFSRDKEKGADLIRPFYIHELFSLIEKGRTGDAGQSADNSENAEKEPKNLSLYNASDKTAPVYLSDGHLYVLGSKIKLSKKEYALMNLLLMKKGNIVTYAEAAKIFNGNPDSNTVNVYIRYLRKKIAEVTSLNIIENIRETGYIIR